MLTITIILSGVLVTAALVQLGFACWFRKHFPTRPTITFQTENQNFAPSVAIIICVRGCDPSLEGCLKGVLTQDYPNYEVHLVIDSQTDQGWQSVQPFCNSDNVGQHSRKLNVHILRNISDRCGLKCNAILQGLKHVSTQAEYLLLIDADVTPHPDWIVQLIGPLAHHADVGLVCGTQWFEPPSPCTWGSLVRSIWNGGAMVPTVVFNNPWAGSLAMRMKDVRRANIPETWSKSIVDDGPLRQCLARLGLKCYFAPSLVMVNQENCSFRYAIQWMTRMLLWSRLYESNYWLSVVHSVFSTTTMTFLFGIILWAVWGQKWMTAAIATAALIACGFLSLGAYFAVRQTVQISRRYQARPKLPISGWRIFQLFWAVPLTQWVYLFACLRAFITTKISWRGVTYKIYAPDHLQIVENRSIDAKEADQQMSI